MKIEGRNAVMEMILSGNSIEKIYIESSINDGLKKSLLSKIKERSIQYSIVEKSALDRISDTGKHQGIIAIVSEYKYASLQDIFDLAKQKKEDEFILILDKIKDPQNLGSIIRTAECAGVHGIIIPKHRSIYVNETVIKTSSGAASHMLIAKVTNINDTIKKIKQRGNFVYALDAKGKNIYKSNLKGNISLVIGSEGEGVSKHTLSLCDEIISLPLNGKINSLNAGVATAIGAYEVIRQRCK